MHPIPLNLQEALRLIEDLSSAYITINVSNLGRRSMPGGRLKKLFPVKFIFSRDNRLPKYFIKKKQQTPKIGQYRAFRQSTITKI